MKKILLILLGLILLAAGGTAAYVASIDWNQHKDKIAAQFTAATGKQIVFAGPISFKFLPSPYLSASNVRIFNQGAEKEPLMEIRNLVATLSLLPLLQGNFDVKRMVLENPVINVEVDDEGRLNWEQPAGAGGETGEKTEITLNSVGIEKATLHFNYPLHDIALQLDNLNGEVNAQSLTGPYRIEGNYVRDNVPQGFAVSVGKLSESFATTLNLVLTHPVSKSYVRFDGSFQLSNKVLNGSAIIESEKLREYVRNNFKQVELKPEYDYPLALTADIAANPEQIALSNMVIKYGETQGAGNVLIPLNDGWLKTDEAIKPRLDMAFNFTDFNLDPVVFAVKEFISKHADGKQSYEPALPLDMLVDVKSVRTVYNGQPVKNFEASFDVIDNILSINNLTAVLPGETDLKLRGDINSVDGEPFYNLDAAFNSNDFLKTLNWMKLNPPVSTASTYRKAVGNAKLSGTLQKIQVSPFTLTVDKTSFSGEAGIKRGERLDAMLVLKADMVNFDNYISALPAEEKNKNWSQRMQYRFGQLGFLNDFDMIIDTHFDLAIYENMPFEKVDFKANLLNGKMDIQQLAIASAANAKFDVSGKLSGFGKAPSYENIKYNLKTADVAALINKFEFKAPNLDYKQLKDFESRGIMTGNTSKMAIKAVSKLENLDFVYGGQIDFKEAATEYNGELELKHPDFVEMLNNFNWNYNPQTYSLGLFNLKTKLTGSARQFKADPLEFNIGFNSFSGDAAYDENGERPSILTTLNINKFEIERFINKGAVESGPAVGAAKEEAAEFLALPELSQSRFNFDFYKKFDLRGTFRIGDLSYKDKFLKNAGFEASLLNGAAHLTGISGEYNGGTVSGELTLNMLDKPNLSATASFEGIDVDALGLGGSKYALSGGKISYKTVLNGGAASWNELARTVTGSVDFDMTDIVVKGWNLEAIYADITKREVTEGLLALVKENLQAGHSPFKSFKGKMALNEGTFSLSDAAMQNSGLKIDVYGDGSLADWTMNVLFNVKYDEPRYLPGYSFSLKGPMNAPLTDVDVSALFSLYKSRQDKIAAQERAVIEAEQNRLKGLAGEQKKTADNLLREVQEKITPDLQQKQDTAFSDAAKADYSKLRTRLENQSAEIAAVSNRGLEPDMTEAIIAEMALGNQKAVAALEKIKKELELVYLGDVRVQTDNLYEQLVENYNKSKMLIFNYNTAKDGFVMRLAAITTDFKPEADVNISGWQQFIDDKAAGLENQNRELMDRYTALKQAGSAAAVAEYNIQLNELVEAVESDVKAMEESIADYQKYTESKVSEAEEAYAEQRRQEEVRRKLEENTGSISIKKTGKSVTVKRDIEEIEKSEELTSQDKVKVLDFSKPQVRKEVPEAPKESVVKKGRVTRK